MKLRLPLALVSALLFGYAASGADSSDANLSDKTITEDTNFTSDYSWSNGPTVIGVAGGGASPVIDLNFLMICSKEDTNNTFEVLSGKVNVNKDAGDFWGNAYSIWVGKDDKAGDSTLSVRGGEFTAKTVLLGGGAQPSTAINLYGGVTRFSGIYNGYSNVASQGKPGAINLMGGTLQLGEQGLWALHPLVSGETLTSYAVNLYSGTLGAYASWSSGDKTWKFADGAWALDTELTENRLVWQLDYAGAVLPDGTISDGKGHLNIAPEEGTTITASSPIKGDGTGNLTKTGKGTLLVTSTANTFTQNVVLAGGALVISKDGALGASAKTITVTHDGSAESSSFDIRDLTWSLRYTDYSFLAQDGAKLYFPKGNGVMFGFGGLMTFESGSTVIFEDKAMIDNTGDPVVKMKVDTGASVIVKDVLYIAKSAQVALSGTMTVEKTNGEEGLSIGGYHGTWWKTSQLIIEEGGLLEMKGASVTLGKSAEAGQLIIKEGGRATVWGIEDKGAWGRIVISGGTLDLGKGGIHFHDQLNNWDNSANSGESYLSDVYFSSGKIIVNEDSAYTYTGEKTFPASGGRPESVYIGGFFFGKDDTGALDDPTSVRTIEVGPDATFSLTETVLGDGGFHKTGAGTVVLTVANGYKGDTVVEEGSLHLGDDASLGTTGKLTLLSGTALSTLDKSVALTNKADLGKTGDSTYTAAFGRAGSNDTLSLNGETRLLATEATLDIQSDTTFGGGFSGNTSTITKTGAGTLTFGQTLTGVQTLHVSQGGLTLDVASAPNGVKTLNMAAATTLDLRGRAGTADMTVNIEAGEITLKGFGTYGGGVVMQEYDSRLNIEGNFQTGKISFKLGSDNASFDGAVKTLVTHTGTAAITGTEAGSIVLNFDADYIHTFLDAGGMFQLFSSGLNYQKGIIQNNQRKIIMLDETALATTGTLVWKRIALSADLITQNMADGMTHYVPQGSQSYLGSQGGTVVTGENLVYDLGEDTTYNLTPGLGTLVYRGQLQGADHELSIMGYGEIDKNAAPGEGSVIITHNSNNYGAGTIVTGGRLTVDLSQGANPEALTGQAQNGNLEVSALGTGTVRGVSGARGGSEIILQAYGNQTLNGVDTYTYANHFELSGNSQLKQAGNNIQILTGDITSGAGANALVNAGSRDMILRGNITQETGDALTLKSETAAGRILLEGDRKLTAPQLNISGTGEIRVSNGYTVAVMGLNLETGTLNIAGNGTLTLGKNGLGGAGTLVLNGGTLNSSSSWNADTAVTLGTGQNTISTGGANVRLNKGVTGEGGFIKQGTGDLYLYDNPAGNAKGLMEARQGRLVLLGATQTRDGSAAANSEYKLAGDLLLASGKGASLQGRINANGHNVTFEDGTRFYLEVTGEAGVSGYIRDAGTLSFGTGTQLHVDILEDTWTTENTYTLFSARENIQGAGNLELILSSEYAFVDVSLNLNNNKEVGLNLTRKGGAAGGADSMSGNKGAIHAVVSPLVDGVLDDSTELTGKLKKQMQQVSKMTKTQYQDYLSGMGNSASSFYTALSAQVQDMTLHVNSVRNRVELLNPVLYDDWANGGIYNVWAGGINHYRDVKSGSEAPGYEMTTWGGELGCAVPLSQTFMLGAGFAYTYSDVQVKDGWGDNESDTYTVDLFARYRKNALTVTGVLSGGTSNTEFHRNQHMKDQYQRANSSTDGNQFLGTLEIGYDLYLNEEKSWILQPLANITTGRAKLDGLSETGELQNAGLAIGSQNYNMFSAGIGAKLAYEYKTDASDLPGRVELKLMYVNDMGDTGFEVNGRFLGAPQKGFDLKGVSNERSAALVSAGWIAPISTYGQFFVDAGCEFRKDQNGVNSTIGFSFQF